MRRRSRASLRPPADLRDRLGIPARERILAWGSGPKPAGVADAEPDYVAATDRSLYVEGTGACYPWDSIGRASWSEPVLEVQLLDANGATGPTLRLRVNESGDLPAAVHDRVTASVLVSERVEIADGVRARMVARRAHDDAPVRWSVVFDAGVDASDPQLQRLARAALDDLRSALGI
jgi:hypothetical protein